MTCARAEYALDLLVLSYSASGLVFGSVQQYPGWDAKPGSAYRKLRRRIRASESAAVVRHPSGASADHPEHQTVVPGNLRTTKRWRSSRRLEKSGLAACVTISGNSEQCLARVYEARILQLEHRILGSRNSCPVEEKLLLGSWHETGSADFEEFALVQDSEGTGFISWLHGKPELAGKWVFDKCLIKISNPDLPDLDFTFRVLRLSKRGPILENVDDKTLSTYRKVQ